jgi:hypothetical protein
LRGEEADIALQYGRLDVPARHGVAFPLVKKLLAFNTEQRVEVVVLSKNDPVRAPIPRARADGGACALSSTSEVA